MNMRQHKQRKIKLLQLMLRLRVLKAKVEKIVTSVVVDALINAYQKTRSRYQQMVDNAAATVRETIRKSPAMMAAFTQKPNFQNSGSHDVHGTKHQQAAFAHLANCRSSGKGRRRY